MIVMMIMIIMMILHMARSGLEVPEPVPNLAGDLQSLENLGQTKNIVR